MEAHTFLIQLVLVLLSARIVGEIAAYFKFPSVVGELVAGILIGPSVFGFVGISVPMDLLAEIGIILLLFEVGMETDIKRLTSSGPKALLVALGGVVFPFVLGFYTSYSLFHFTLLASLFIGSTLTATSIGITLRVLRDLKKQDSHEAQIILGAAVFDDVIGIILLVMLYEFSLSGVVDVWHAAKVLICVVLFFCLSPIAAKGISHIIKKWEEKSDIPGLLEATIVSLILLFAWIAYQLGAPELLGGFAAGIALSKQFRFPFIKSFPKNVGFNERIEKHMKPIIHLFAPIFFVSIGLSLNLRSVEWSSQYIWILMGALFTVALFGKLLAGFLLKGETRSTKWAIGTAMIPRGEVGLIFANIGLTAGVFKQDIYTAVVLVIALTTLLAPVFLRFVYQKTEKKLFGLF
jgi:Kef-type K+ transport system membrane component KefB